jgi:hypothetical protein
MIFPIVVLELLFIICFCVHASTVNERVFSGARLYACHKNSQDICIPIETFEVAEIDEKICSPSLKIKAYFKHPDPNNSSNTITNKKVARLTQDGRVINNPDELSLGEKIDCRRTKRFTNDCFVYFILH